MSPRYLSPHILPQLPVDRYLYPVPRQAFDVIAEARRQWEEHDLAEPTAMAAATSMIRVNQILAAAIDRELRPLDLTFARYEVLMLLRFSRAGALPMTKVADRLMVHPTGVTKLVDRLEQDGLVRREANPADRRGVLVRITSSGRRLAARGSRAVGAIRFGMLSDDDELEALISLLERFRERAGDFETRTNA
jgi:DNA-binding MarR family transcriptional regulator